VSLPRGSGAPTPAAVARALLDSIEAWYAEHAADEVDPAVEPPPHRFIAGGAPREAAWDYDDGQLTVAYDSLITTLNPTAAVTAQRLPRTNPGNAGKLVRSVVLEVQMVRPAPALDFYGRFPGRDEKDAHGYLLGVDAHHVAKACAEAARSGALVRDGVVVESLMLVGNMQTLGPMGKLAGIAQQITVPLL
jgi:hypothetical protein